MHKIARKNVKYILNYFVGNSWWGQLKGFKAPSGNPFSGSEPLIGLVLFLPGIGDNFCLKLEALQCMMHICLSVTISCPPFNTRTTIIHRTVQIWTHLKKLVPL